VAELTWAATVNWTLEASVGHLESSIGRLDINPLAVIPHGYTVVNATFIAAPAGGPWRVTLGVNNATGKLYTIGRVNISGRWLTSFDALPWGIV
jgi:hypothetical protein